MEKSIKAIGVEEVGDAKNLKLVKMPPQKMEPRDILVEVKAVSINPVDWKNRMWGIWSSHKITKDDPLVVGQDACGKVVQVGADVKWQKIGDDVWYAGDATRAGSNAQYQVVDERIVGRKPKNLTYAQASALPLTSLTAWEGIFEGFDLKIENKKAYSGKHILIFAGAGGVGSIAIQIAKKLLGLTVIATASRTETIQYCKELGKNKIQLVIGADYVIAHQKLKDEFAKQSLPKVDQVFICHTTTQDKVQEISEIVAPLAKVCGITGFDKPINLMPLWINRCTFVMELMFTRSMKKFEMEKQQEILDKVAKLVEEGVIITTMKEVKPFNVENLIAEHIFSFEGKCIGKHVLDKVDEFFGSH